ncbi:MAG: class IV adenylate cyclase [Bacilli bacterium]|jgi:predicted adenylyl cyclase CyaB|nr:class IV adenylate cyclase [Bacilli bacterium]
MKEMEISVAFDNNKDEVLKILSQFNFIGEKELYDTYYIDPLRNNLKPEKDLRLNETFRIRRSNATCLITYKKQHFKGKLWTYSDEYETEVKDYKTIEKIVLMLGLEPLIIVHNKRRIYQYKDYEIAFEEVENLGYLLEIEKLSTDAKNAIEIKKELRQFIRSLKLKNVKELNIGKNQYLLSKKLGYNLKVFNDTMYK